jgi:hypothetical protein
MGENTVIEQDVNQINLWQSDEFSSSRITGTNADVSIMSTATLALVETVLQFLTSGYFTTSSGLDQDPATVIDETSTAANISLGTQELLVDHTFAANILSLLRADTKLPIILGSDDVLLKSSYGKILGSDTVLAGFSLSANTSLPTTQNTASSDFPLLSFSCPHECVQDLDAAVDAASLRASLNANPSAAEASAFLSTNGPLSDCPAPGDISVHLGPAAILSQNQQSQLDPFYVNALISDDTVDPTATEIAFAGIGDLPNCGVMNRARTPTSKPVVGDICGTQGQVYIMNDSTSSDTLHSDTGASDATPHHAPSSVSLPILAASEETPIARPSLPALLSVQITAAIVDGALSHTVPHIIGPNTDLLTVNPFPPLITNDTLENYHKSNTSTDGAIAQPERPNTPTQYRRAKPSSSYIQDAVRPVVMSTPNDVFLMAFWDRSVQPINISGGTHAVDRGIIVNI